MDEDRRRVCACGCVGGTGGTAAGPCPWCREEGTGEEQGGHAKRVFVFLAKASPMKAKQSVQYMRTPPWLLGEDRVP